MNENSILLSIKNLLGIENDVTAFDIELIIHINSVFATLFQMGVGKKTPFKICDDTAVWNDVLENKDDMDMLKTYVFLKVKMIFDPPMNSIVAEAYKETIKEYECRLYLLENFEHKEN